MYVCVRLHVRSVYVCVFVCVRVCYYGYPWLCRGTHFRGKRDEPGTEQPKTDIIPVTVRSLV